MNMIDNQNVGGLLDELRTVLDARADLAAKDAPLATRKLEIEIDLLRNIKMVCEWAIKEIEGAEKPTAE